MSQDLEQAISLLKIYSGIVPKTVESETEKQELRSAIKLIVSVADAQNLGICASNAQEAFDSLDNYLRAFGYNFNYPTNIISENNPVYLKFSTERMSYSLSSYDGQYRGVLITIFADKQDNIVGTYGYFPINLFAEE